MRILSTLFFTLAIFWVAAQGLVPYKLYDGKGNEIQYNDMLAKLNEADMVMFGEQHNNAIAHWLQYEVTKSLNETRKLVLGAEMLEADNQDELDDYLSGKIDAKAFDTLARLWPNYDTDYAKLVDFAKDNKLAFVATNVPRRFANKVYRGGFEILEELSDEEKAWVAPLPIPYDANLPRYQEILKMMGEHGTPELVMAQAVKDATMAHFIIENWKKKKLFIHYNGRYHSDYHEGIVWYLQQYGKGQKVLTITTVEQEDINSLDEENKDGVADFVICVDADMTTTY